MKRSILASATASTLLLSGAAVAADVSIDPGHDWSGFYIGANAGVAWNNSELDNEFIYSGVSDTFRNEAAALGNDLTDNDSVFSGGAMIGYNWQHDSVVLGLEADISYLGFSGERELTRDHPLTTLPLNATHEVSFEADWFGTLRGRLGFAADNLLFYGTGGLAYGHMEASSDLRFYDGTTGLETSGNLEGLWEGSVDDVNWGWTIGAGMEYGIDSWSLGVEYLFVDLGDADWNASNKLRGFTDYRSEGSVDYQFSVARATLKYAF